MEYLDQIVFGLSCLVLLYKRFVSLLVEDLEKVEIIISREYVYLI